MSYSDDTASEIKSATSSRLDSSAVSTSSPHDRLSHFIDDSCLKTIALEDDASTAEETRALRSNSPANMDTAQDEALHKTVVLHFDKSYPFTIVGALRIAILFLSLLSLICIASAGTKDYDILQLPRSERVRLHLFVCVLAFLLTAALMVVDNSSIVHILPLNWALIDTVLWGVLALLFLVSSSLLIHNKMLYQRAYFAIVDWTCSLFLVSGIFGLGCVCSCFALGVLRLCRHKAPLRLSSGVANQDIMMSPITIS
ncbi:uncharacterized protein LOC119177221 [Rhipicephalus microplus]|uniref:uncharacterized protein LOC119177221 n=1 Tax=Rhipicephalus microplus TaxID=6941 RepID=UPI003F6AE94D